MRAILTYHSIDPSGSVISIGADAFRRHVRWLASGAVRVVRPAELLALPPHEDAVALTFDDGFDNFRTVAAPALAEHGLTATVFVVSGRVGRTNAWEPAGGPIPSMALMGWDALGRLFEDGFEIGAHTRTHARLTTVTGAELRDEIAGSAEDIRRELGVTPTSFAYPYGAFGVEAEAAAVRTFPVVVTTELDVLNPRPAPTRLPRLDMYYYEGAGRLEAFGTPRFQRHLALRRAARTLRARLRRKERA